jgi:uncharacterized protein (DUF58 family)
MRERLHIISDLYIAPRFYAAGFVLAMLFIAGYFNEMIYLLSKIALLFSVILIISDLFLLFFTGRNRILLTRETPEKFSNGDENTVALFIKNNNNHTVVATIIDELPVQFQVRSFAMSIKLRSTGEKHLEYTVRPTERGEYQFGRTLVYCSSPVGLLQRRYIFNRNAVCVPTYPSFLNIRKFEFLAISNRLTEAGIKRIRKIGRHSEFDQIKEYVHGDDSRTINWKATAKKSKLMTNQYQDERSQQIYNIIDMGRLMKMPFNHLALLDYAINSSLVLANTAVFKHDKAGLITFNTGINTFMPAERKNNTIVAMMERLYNQKTLFAESNYDLLFTSVKRLIPHRSLLILYTNFESMASIKRQLTSFQKIARNHLLLVVFFENTEISTFRRKEARTLEEIYMQTIAEKFIYDKHLIVKELSNHGILSVLSRPHDLSVNLVNKYLELKDRNLL